MRNLVIAGKSNPGLMSIDSHAHPCWELIYYTSGTGVLTCGGKKYQFRPHDFVLLPPKTRHSEVSDDGYGLLFCMFSECLLPKDTILFLHDTSANDIESTLFQIHKEYYLKRGNYHNILDSLLNVVHQYIVSWYGNKRRTLYIEKFVDLLIYNLANNGFQLKEAMAGIPFTMDHFRRIFKNEIGMTPSQFLEYIRIKNAKHLLTSKSFKIREVAFLSGYSDPYYFSRVFHKHTGFSPREYDGSTEPVIPFVSS